MPAYYNGTSTRIVETVRDENGIDLVIEVQPGKSIVTEYILTNASLTKTSDEPFWSPLQEPVNVLASTGSDDPKTLVLATKTMAVSVYNPSSVLVSCYIQSLDNAKFLYCYVNAERIIPVGGNCSQLIFTFPSAATIYVEQRRM